MSTLAAPGWDVTMLLCDAAESVGGKLYVLGGGWSQVLRPNVPTNMALAIKVAVPWSHANRQIPFQCKLVDGDGQHVLNDAGDEIGAEGNIEVGRPAGLQAGTSLDAPMVLNFGGIPLPPGIYTWQLTIDGELRARTSFRVLGDIGGTPA